MAAQVLPSVVSLDVCPCLHPQCVDSRCTRLRRQEEVNARLCAPVEMGVWACASQFSRLTGSVLWGRQLGQAGGEWGTGRYAVPHLTLCLGGLQNPLLMCYVSLSIIIISLL